MFHRALYLDNRRYDEAKHVLQRLRGTKDVDDELDSLRKQATDAVQIKPMSVKQVLGYVLWFTVLPSLKNRWVDCTQHYRIVVFWWRLKLSSFLQNIVAFFR